MHLWIVACSGAAGQAFTRALHRLDLPVDRRWPPEALVLPLTVRADPTLVLYEAERWEERATDAIARWQGAGAQVVAVSRAATDPSVRAELLARGATEVLVDDDQVLPSVLASVRWWVEQQMPARVRLGDLVFDPIGDVLVGKTARVGLTAKERQLLWTLYQDHAADRVQSRSARSLAAALGTSPDAVRQFVRGLQAKAELDLGHPRLIGRNRARGYFLLPPPPGPPRT